MATEYDAQTHGTSMRSYRDPGATGGTASDIGVQTRTDYFQKKALIEARKEQYFSQLANVTAMPKHYGKKIIRYHYLPLLDDANINDQGIDAAGVIQTDTVTVETRFAPSAVTLDGTEGQLGNRYPNNEGPIYSSGSGVYKIFSVGADLAAAGRGDGQGCHTDRMDQGHTTGARRFRDLVRGPARLDLRVL